MLHRSLPPPRSFSVFKVFWKIFIPLWIILAPIGIIYFILTIPFRFLSYILGGCKKKQDKPMKVEITECS